MVVISQVLLSHIHSAAGLPWCNIQTYLLFYFELFFTWGSSMDHYSFSHSIALFIRFFLPGLRFRRPLRSFQWWSSSLEQTSRSELVHTVIEGLISWRQVYMVRSGIRFFGLIFALWCMSNTYACHVRMIMVTYAYIVLMLETCAMTNQRTCCEDCLSCHACTNSHP